MLEIILPEVLTVYENRQSETFREVGERANLIVNINLELSYIRLGQLAGL